MLRPEYSSSVSYSAAKSNREDGFEGDFGLFLVLCNHICFKAASECKITTIQGKKSDLGVISFRVSFVCLVRSTATTQLSSTFTTQMNLVSRS